MWWGYGFSNHGFQGNSRFPTFPPALWWQFGGNYGGSHGGNRIAEGLEGKEETMAELNYTTRSIRRHGAENMWEVTLSHRNPITGEVVRTYHKVEAKTKRQVCFVKPSPTKSAL